MTGADLKPHQRELLEMLLAGKTVVQIAFKLDAAEHSVYQKICRLRKKVGVRTLLQLGAWAERHGIREAA